MKDLEERVMQPLGMRMLDGLKIIPVGTDERRDLAAWAFKTAAVGQTHLYTRLEPPPNVVVDRADARAGF